MALSEAPFRGKPGPARHPQPRPWLLLARVGPPPWRLPSKPTGPAHANLAEDTPGLFQLPGGWPAVKGVAPQTFPRRLKHAGLGTAAGVKSGPRHRSPAGRQLSVCYVVVQDVAKHPGAQRDSWLSANPTRLSFTRRPCGHRRQLVGPRSPQYAPRPTVPRGANNRVSLESLRNRRVRGVVEDGRGLDHPRRSRLHPLLPPRLAGAPPRRPRPPIPGHEPPPWSSWW